MQLLAGANAEHVPCAGCNRVGLCAYTQTSMKRHTRHRSATQISDTDQRHRSATRNTQTQKTRHDRRANIASHSTFRLSLQQIDSKCEAIIKLRTSGEARAAARASPGGERGARPPPRLPPRYSQAGTFLFAVDPASYADANAALAMFGKVAGVRRSLESVVYTGATTVGLENMLIPGTAFALLAENGNVE